ncbi:hypothetical protein ES703_46811 [subsurface metagenome]
MKRNYLILLVLAILVFSGCAQPAPTPTPTSEPATPAPSPEPATPAPTPEPAAPTPTLATIPEEILASRFGIDGAVQDMDGISKLGIRWNRSPLPFVWGLIEPERGEYTWRRRVDGYVEKNQAYNFAILAIIWPFAEWDQANWGPAPADTDPILDEEFLGRSRRKPYDMDAYRRFVSALVERYDGDGIGDMPGLRYPIKYWQAGLAPSVQEGYYAYFDGSSEDYLEVLKATYQAVKEADPEAKVLHAGMGAMKPENVSFWEPIFEKGSQYFDIANVHIIWPFAEMGAPKLARTGAIARAELTVPEFKKLLSEYGIDKPIWVTEASYDTWNDVSLEEHGQIFVRSYVSSFASGADKFFYYIYRALPSESSLAKRLALIDENGERRPAAYGLKTLIEKLDRFTSAEKLAEGQYKFMVEGEAIYVLWGSGKIPEEITGEVLVTDIYGKETRTDSSAIKLTESPIFVEEHPD